MQATKPLKNSSIPRMNRSISVNNNISTRDQLNSQKTVNKSTNQLYK